MTSPASKRQPAHLPRDRLQLRGGERGEDRVLAQERELADRDLRAGVDGPQADPGDADGHRKHQPEGDEGDRDAPQPDQDRDQDRAHRERRHADALEGTEQPREDPVLRHALEHRPTGDVHDREPDPGHGEQRCGGRGTGGAGQHDEGEADGDRAAGQRGASRRRPARANVSDASGDRPEAHRRVEHTGAGLARPEHLEGQQHVQDVQGPDHQHPHAEQSHDQSGVGVRGQGSQATDDAPPTGLGLEALRVLVLASTGGAGLGSLHRPVAGWIVVQPPGIGRRTTRSAPRRPLRPPRGRRTPGSRRPGSRRRPGARAASRAPPRSPPGRSRPSAPRASVRSSAAAHPAWGE